MRLSASPWTNLLLALAALLLDGCLPEGQGQVAEEKDAHFLNGRSQVNSMNYPAAIESFERALAVNPKSAAAHLELACLFDQKVPDPAAAVYHYERFLKLRLNSPKADAVNQRILACKLELLRSVSLGPLSEKQRRDLEKLAEDNKRLTEENRRLNDETARWRAFYASQVSAATSPPPRALTVATDQPATTAEPRPAQAGLGTSPRPSGASLSSSTPPAMTNPPLPHTPASLRPIAPRWPRTHTVRAGETLSAIAQQHGLRLDALLAANPGVNPRRLHPGQAINLPAP
jgi:tetratricopeptide (TPR) repeat protein